MKIALVSERAASPLAVLGGVEEGAGTYTSPSCPRRWPAAGNGIPVYTRREDPAVPERVHRHRRATPWSMSLPGRPSRCQRTNFCSTWVPSLNTWTRSGLSTDPTLCTRTSGCPALPPNWRPAISVCPRFNVPCARRGQAPTPECQRHESARPVAVRVDGGQGSDLGRGDLHRRRLRVDADGQAAQPNIRGSLRRRQSPVHPGGPAAAGRDASHRQRGKVGAAQRVRRHGAGEPSIPHAELVIVGGPKPTELHQRFGGSTVARPRR